MKKNLVWVSAALSLSFVAFTTQAAEPLAFQGVMRDLEKNMQVITGAIAQEDWELVAKTAPKIAEHPQPPLGEKARIIGFMGSNMRKFKAFDMQTHEGAHEMAQAAAAKDGMQVINTFQKVQTSCLGCHQTFRSAFVEHFYGNKSEAGK